VSIGSVDVRILKWILKKQDVTVWTATQGKARRISKDDNGPPRGRPACRGVSRLILYNTVNYAGVELIVSLSDAREKWEMHTEFCSNA
jgi:hypothetical protein